MACNHASVNCRCNVMYDFSNKSKWKPILDKSVAQEGMTLEEIGETLGISRMAVCKQVHRTLAKIKLILEENGYTATDI